MAERAGDGARGAHVCSAPTSTPWVGSHSSLDKIRCVDSLTWMAPGREEASMRCAVFIVSLRVRILTYWDKFRMMQDEMWQRQQLVTAFK